MSLKDQKHEDGLLMTFQKLYGPYAFGVAALLIVWYVIVGPELRARQIDFESYHKTVLTQQEIVSSLQSTSRTLETTAVILERTVSRLEDVK